MHVNQSTKGAIVSLFSHKNKLRSAAATVALLSSVSRWRQSATKTGIIGEAAHCRAMCGA